MESSKIPSASPIVDRFNAGQSKMDLALGIRAVFAATCLPLGACLAYRW
ncbi:hypothetical protein FRC0043_00574 [Corynebacterium belfantii]|nr:hypothetical protein FRC0043_00574 [Corynebacterium belfantii]